MSVIPKDSNLAPISLDTGIDLTGASSVEIIFNKPGGTKGTWSASVNGSAIEYNTSNGDLDQSGKWRLMAGWVQSGRQYYSNEYTLIVVSRPEST